MNPITDNQGSIYVIHAVGTNRIKIGFSETLKSRLSGLHTASPFPLVILASWPGTESGEKAIHRQLDQFRRNGEWFELPPLCGITAQDLQAISDNPSLAGTGWKQSRVRPELQIGRISGYDIVEGEYGVSYLFVVGRSRGRKLTSADCDQYEHAGFYPWFALEAAGRLRSVGAQ